MRTISNFIIVLAVILVTGCGAGTNPTLPDNSSGVPGSDSVILAVIDMSYDELTHTGQVVSDRTSEVTSDTSSYDVSWMVRFQEYDPNFAHILGDPDAEDFGNFDNPLDELNDGFIFDVSVVLDESETVTLYDPRVIIEFDEIPEFTPLAPREMLVVNSHDYIDLWGGATEFEDLLPCRYLTKPAEDHRSPSRRVLEPQDMESTNEIGTELRIRIIDEGEPYYAPVQWTVYIVADTAQSTEAVRIDTAREKTDEFSQTIAADNTFVLTITADIYHKNGTSDSGLPSGYSVIADLSTLSALFDGVPGSVTLIQSGTNPVEWTKSQLITITNPNPIPQNINKIVRVPIEVRNSSTELVIGDVHIFSFQSNVPANYDYGHYMMSYIARDDDTGRQSMYLMDTFSGESIKISNTHPVVEDGIFSNSISENGERVVWTENYYSVSDIQKGCIWDYRSGTPSLGSLPFSDTQEIDSIVKPEISPDGKYVVYQECEDSPDEYTRVVIYGVDEFDNSHYKEVIEDWDDIDESGEEDDKIHPWLPEISNSFEMISPYPAFDMGYYDTCYLVIFPMIGCPDMLGDELSRMGAVLLCENDTYGASILKLPDPYTILSAVSDEIGGSQYISRISIIADPVVEIDNAPVEGSGIPEDRLITNVIKFYITFESDKNGTNRTFLTSLEITVTKRYEWDDPEWITVENGFNIVSNSFTDEAINISPDDILEENPCNFFAESNLASNGTILSVLRAGNDRDINTWLYVSIPGTGEFNIPLGVKLDMAEGEHDIPSISQGNFDLTGSSAAYPAVAFDSHHASTGDIYLLRLVDFDSQATPPIAVTFKRLTHNGCSYWPRLSGWIEP